MNRIGAKARGSECFDKSKEMIAARFEGWILIETRRSGRKKQRVARRSQLDGDTEALGRRSRRWDRNKPRTRKPLTKHRTARRTETAGPAGGEDACDWCTDRDDSDCDLDPSCQCLSPGSSCTDDAEGCSNKCKGPPGGKTCK